MHFIVLKGKNDFSALQDRCRDREGVEKVRQKAAQFGIIPVPFCAHGNIITDLWI